MEEANGTYTITAINEAGHTTVIKATGLKGLSDTLTNKETVEVSVGEGFLKTIELEPYKDYVVKSLLLPEITAKKKDSSANLYFTNVVLTYDDWISKVAKKDLDFKFLDTWGANVPDANVLIKGRDIRIRGNIKAKIVNIIAEDKTEEITDVYSKTNDGDMFDLWTNVWNMYRGSSIKVMEKVTVEAEYVLMNVTQTADISKTIGLMQKHQSETDQNNNSGSEGGDSGNTGDNSGNTGDNSGTAITPATPAITPVIPPAMIQISLQALTRMIPAPATIRAAQVPAMIRAAAALAMIRAAAALATIRAAAVPALISSRLRTRRKIMS